MARRIGTYETSILPYEDCCNGFCRQASQDQTLAGRRDVRKRMDWTLTRWWQAPWSISRRFIYENRKLSNRDLQRLVLDRLPKSHRFVTSGPAVGQDCSAIRFGDGLCLFCPQIRSQAQHPISVAAIVLVNVNDIATCGIRPTALLLTIIVPPDYGPTSCAKHRPGSRHRRKVKCQHRRRSYRGQRCRQSHDHLLNSNRIYLWQSDHTILRCPCR